MLLPPASWQVGRPKVKEEEDGDDEDDEDDEDAQQHNEGHNELRIEGRPSLCATKLVVTLRSDLRSNIFHNILCSNCVVRSHTHI